MAKTNNNTNRTFITALKIFGGALFIAALSFSILAAVKVLNSKPADSQEDDDNKTEIVHNPEQKSDDEKEDEQSVAENDPKKKTEELEKELNKEVEKNANGLKKASVVLNEPYKVGTKTIISSTITNIVETDGVCTYIFAKGSSSMAKTTKVLPNAKNTVCEAVVFQKGDIDAGTWSVRLEYKSKTSEGVSETQTFTIQ